MRNVLVCLLLLMVMVACGTAPSPGQVATIPPSSPAPPSPAVSATAPVLAPPVVSPSLASPALSWAAAGLNDGSLRHLQLLDRENGWAITDSGVYHLQGGRWENVIPADGTGTPLTSFFFLDNQHAWLLKLGEGTFTSGSLYHTSDGGKRWESIAVPFSMATFDFVNAEQGWAMAELGSGAGKSAIAIYQTQDAGHRWDLQFVNDPNMAGARQDIPLAGMKNGLMARDLKTAWVTGTVYAPLIPYLYITHDGGKSWQQQPLVFPEGDPNAMALVQSPILLSASEMLLPVELVGDLTRTVIYISRDGGESWQPAVTLNGRGRFQAFSLQEWLFWSENLLFYTKDGGQNWEIRTPQRTFGNELPGIQFLTPQEGFLWANSIEGHASIYHTADGGWTWIQIYP